MDTNKPKHQQLEFYKALASWNKTATVKLSFRYSPQAKRLANPAVQSRTFRYPELLPRIECIVIFGRDNGEAKLRHPQTGERINKTEVSQRYTAKTSCRSRAVLVVTEEAKF